MKNYEREELEKKMQMKDENLKSLQSQIEMYKKSEAQLKKQVKEGKPGAGMTASELKKQERKKKGSTGCCGGDGCTIM